MKFFTLVTLFALSLGQVNSHLLISLPSTWGLSTSLENPLNAGSTNWFCHGQRKDTSAVTTLNAGSSISVPIVCGEAIGNPQNGGSSCSNDPNAYHGGGGCGLSIAYKTSPTIDDFVMFTVNHDCPKLGQAMISFQIPPNLPSGDAVCSWTWIPDPRASANEMYMNCFNCRVQGGSSGNITSGILLKNHLWAVPGVGSSGSRPLYKNVLPNGALALQVSSGPTSSSTVTSSTVTSSSDSTSATTTTTTTSSTPTSCRRRTRPT